MDAMLAGGSVRMLLDSSWFNYERNSQVAENMTALAALRGLDGEFRLLDNRSPVTVLHNKGAVMDGATTLISSNNWGYSSFARNREVAVLVESPEIASYFARAFEMDWEPDSEPPVARCGDRLEAALGELVCLDGSGSSDDRGVVRWTWDLHGDGTTDGDGCRFEFVASKPGELSVLLTVEDSWGNEDSAWVEVAVLTPGQGSTTIPGLARFATLVSIPLACFGGALLGLRLARRWHRLSRKLNQPRED